MYLLLSCETIRNYLLINLIDFLYKRFNYSNISKDTRNFGEKNEISIVLT